MELEEDDCKHMACNWKGIMPGKTGRVWVTEALNQDGSSQGLKIKNGLTENGKSIIPVLDVMCTWGNGLLKLTECENALSKAGEGMNGVKRILSFPYLM